MFKQEDFSNLVEHVAGAFFSSFYILLSFSRERKMIFFLFSPFFYFSHFIRSPVDKLCGHAKDKVIYLFHTVLAFESKTKKKKSCSKPKTSLVRKSYPVYVHATQPCLSNYRNLAFVYFIHI